jgi:hypothetical protein
MQLDQKKRLHEKEIIEKSSEMMRVFLRREAKPPRIAQWKDKCKKQMMKLLWQCYFDEIHPPVELVMLNSCLFGKRHNWSIAKFEVISYLAQTCPPAKSVGKLPRGVKSEVDRIIEKHGGLQRNSRLLNDADGNEEHDYRRIFDKWIKEDAFIRIWQKKYLQYQNRPHDSDALETAKLALQR